MVRKTQRTHAYLKLHGQLDQGVDIHFCSRILRWWSEVYGKVDTD